MHIEFAADYLVPVYDIREGAHFLAEYVNGNRRVNLWALSALRDSGAESILRALVTEKQACINNIAKYDSYDYRIPRIQARIRWMDQLMHELKDPIYHKRADERLTAEIDYDLRRAGYNPNMAHAIYLEGISRIR